MPPQISTRQDPVLGTHYSPAGNSQYVYQTEGRNVWLEEGATGHHGYPNFPDIYDVGGGFRKREILYRANPSAPVTVRSIVTDKDHRYEGTFVPRIDAVTWTGDQYPTADAWGAEAYAKLKPTKPSFEALNAMYELRELPGMLKQRLHQNDLKNIGSYHLALQFGWKPLLSDIVDFVSLQREAQKRLTQLLRDNGKPVRRRVQLVDIHDIWENSTRDEWGAARPFLDTYWHRKAPSIRRIGWTKDKVWASGRFRYWLPGGPRDIRWRRKMLAAIYGLKPSPAVVYNAIPWSWLVDWFSNIGDMVSNLDAGVADRLAAEYVYVMRHLHYGRTAYVTTFNRDLELRDVDTHSSMSLEREWKIRLKGSPFSFAAKDTPLSAMQLSILGALGLSRLK